MAIHAVLAAIAWYGAWYLRLDRHLFDHPKVDYFGRCTELLVWVVAARLLAFAVFDLFQGLWRYVSLPDLVNLFKATALGSVLYIGAIAVHGLAGGGWSGLSEMVLRVFEPENVPRTAFLIEPLLCLVLVGGIRFAIRSYREVFVPQVRGGRRALIVGAGDAGVMLLREMRAHPHLGYDPVGFVDDDPRKLGTKIQGVPVLGRIDDVRDAVQGSAVEEIIVAVRSSSGAEYRRILDLCDSTGVRLRRLPRKVADIVRLTELRDVKFEDLMDRDPVEIDLDLISAAVTRKVVLITGAGGSIGSEIVRQLVPLNPRLIVAVDRSENALFFLERDIAVRHPEARLLVRVLDVQDRVGTMTLFREVAPNFVVHAAAYKHVPLMESHPLQAVRNNVAATLELGRLSIEAGVSRFLLISSDKAVRPTSVMGATKRGAELALATLEPGDTQFVAVRFGNVLGSEGSVVPLFERQIREGGPVTVTHPEVVRYFMTIPEAVGLVLQAATMARGGEVFHLDMGRPVKVLDLAERLIQLHGFRPYDDIEIRFVGLRPGEKMLEELLVSGENVRETEHPRVRALHSAPPDRDLLRSRVSDLLSAAALGTEALIRALSALVPEYAPNNEAYRRALAESPDAAPLRGTPRDESSGPPAESRRAPRQ